MQRVPDLPWPADLFSAVHESMAVHTNQATQGSAEEDEGCWLRAAWKLTDVLLQPSPLFRFA